MRFQLTPGSKLGPLGDSVDDKKIWVATDSCRCGGRELLTLADLGYAFLYWWENEERLYPQGLGFRGGQKVADYLKDCRALGVEAAAVKHQLRFVSRQLELIR
jgi:hypothetical protein